MAKTVKRRRLVALDGVGMSGVGPGPLTDAEFKARADRYFAKFDLTDKKNEGAAARLEALYEKREVEIRADDAEPEPAAEEA